MDTLAKIFESPYTALSIGIVIGALALSGSFNVTATQTLLILAWIVAFVGLRSTPTPIWIGAGAIIGGALLILGYLFRPDAIPSFSGLLSPKVTLLYPPSAGGTIPKLQIGNSGVFIVAPGGGPFSLLFPALETSQLKVESIDGKIKFSTKITDANGDLIAEIIRNEWKVSALGRAWDHNYSDDALEVRDSKGRVVLQVRAMPDRIQIQGAWYIDIGPPNGIRRVIILQPDAQIVFTPPDATDIPSISPMFKYPSDKHLGELAGGP